MAIADKNTLNDDILEEDEDFEDFINTLDFDSDLTSVSQDETNDDKKEETEIKQEDKTSKPGYEVIFHHGLKEGEKPLENVIGHPNQKKELLDVINWFKRSKELKKKGVSIPRGCILFGEAGNGKSLLIKEIIKCIEAPVFILKGDETNVVAGITEIFTKARETGHAVVVIDELDLLINRERRVIRALQENLDGVESSDDILVLAATNFIREIPDALLRNGRLEKLIKIPYPTGEEALELLKKYLKDFNVTIDDAFDEEEVALSLNGISCAGVKAVVNDLVLRNGFENLTTEMLFKSIYNITDRVKDTPDEDNIEVAIHEAAHACMAKAYPQFFTINRINISGASGTFHAKEVEKGFWPYDKIIADIKISMAGILAQKVLCGRGSRGCDDDLQRCRIAAYNMFNICGYSSCWETLPPIRQGSRVETAYKRRKMEKKIERLLKKCEKETIAYIKSNKEKIQHLGALLFDKKHLKSSEILSILG